MTDNENPAAMATLSYKRGEIAGLIAEMEERLAEYRSDLVHIDNALRLMNSPIAGEQALPAKQGIFLTWRIVAPDFRGTPGPENICC